MLVRLVTGPFERGHLYNALAKNVLVDYTVDLQRMASRFGGGASISEEATNSKFTKVASRCNQISIKPALNLRLKESLRQVVISNTNIG